MVVENNECPIFLKTCSVTLKADKSLSDGLPKHYCQTHLTLCSFVVKTQYLMLS